MEIMNEKMTSYLASFSKSYETYFKSLICDKNIPIQETLLIQPDFVSIRGDSLLNPKFIFVDNMLVWDWRKKGDQYIRDKVDFAFEIDFWHGYLSNVEFFSLNSACIHELYDLPQNDCFGIGVLVYKTWKEALKKQFPNEHFFIRLCLGDSELYSCEATVGVHKIRLNEPIGANDLKERDDVAIMCEFI